MNNIEILKANQSATPSKWREKAEWRKENCEWLKKSQQIALTVLNIIGTPKLFSQVELAKEIGVSPQYISRLLKGTENLSLETITKLEKALNVELVTINTFNEITKIKPLSNYRTSRQSARGKITHVVKPQVR